MRRGVFWSAVGTVAYTYVLFPILVMVRGRLRERPYRTGESTPWISVVIAAYNEAGVIGERIENLLSTDYPADRREIVIVSDGSTDGTDEIVRRYEDEGVQLVALPRSGKFVALNAGAKRAGGEILVFSDANTVFAPDALRAIVRPFADEEVGGAAGNQVYLRDRPPSGVAAGEHDYWSFDRALKRAESRAGNVVSATGAIYAIRRSLFEEIPPGVADDFFVSTAVIERGSRLVFVPDAVAYEPVAASSEAEFTRKVRVMTGGLRGVLLRRRLLNPARHGTYALELFSHKVLRRTMAFPILALAVSSVTLSRRARIYRLAAIGQLFFYACALVGIALRRERLGKSRIFALPAFFCMVNAAAVCAIWNILRGTSVDRWEPQRGAPPSSSRTSVPGGEREKASLRGSDG